MKELIRRNKRLQVVLMFICIIIIFAVFGTVVSYGVNVISNRPETIDVSKANIVEMLEDRYGDEYKFKVLESKVQEEDNDIIHYVYKMKANDKIEFYANAYYDYSEKMYYETNFLSAIYLKHHEKIEKIADKYDILFSYSDYSDTQLGKSMTVNYNNDAKNIKKFVKEVHNIPEIKKLWNNYVDGEIDYNFISHFLGTENYFVVSVDPNVKCGLCGYDHEYGHLEDIFVVWDNMNI